jgi:hypothetical protein
MYLLNITELEDLSTKCPAAISSSHKVSLLLRGSDSEAPDAMHYGINHPDSALPLNPLVRFEPISGWVRQCLVDLMAKRELREVISYLKRLRALDPAGSFTGVLFEACCIRYVKSQSAGEVEVCEMGRSKERRNTVFRVQHTSAR